MNKTKWIIALDIAVKENEIRNIEIKTDFSHDNDDCKYKGWKYCAWMHLKNGDSELLCGSNDREEFNEKLNKILNG